MKKILFIVLDGIGDRPIKEFGYLTPLEFANTPNLDRLAEKSICGQLYAISPGIRPSSDVAHMSLFGLDYKQYYTGRGPLELLGCGQQMSESDIAWRGNFCSISPTGLITDRRIGRMTPPPEIIYDLERIRIESVDFTLHHIAEHRFALRASGANLSSAITDSDPHAEGVPPLPVLAKDQTVDANNTRLITNKYISEVNKRLSINPLAQKLGVNSILLRSAGKKPNWPSFLEQYGISSSCCIANNALYNGVGISFGMKVFSYHHFTSYKEYYQKIPAYVNEALKNYEFVFLHIQEGDLFGEDGDYNGKKKAIEEIDETLSFIHSLDLNDVLVIVTADHSTPCALKAHSGDSVPIVIAGVCVRPDDVNTFGERTCSKGALGTLLGRNIMQLVLNYCGRAPLVGG